MNIKRIILEQLNQQYNIVDRETFRDALLDLTTLNLEDDQVHYPKVAAENFSPLFGEKDFDLYLLKQRTLPGSGPFEIFIKNNDDEIIGFIRGTKNNNEISFNLIHIGEDHRGGGIGTSIYEAFLERGFVMKSDTEITDSTYNLYDKLVLYGYKPIVFDDGRVGLKK